MRTFKTTIVLLAVLFIWPVGLGASAIGNAGVRHKALKAASDLHLPFIENRGQVPDTRVAYMVDTFACRAAVTHDGQMVYRPFRDKGAGVAGIEIRERLVGSDVFIDVRGQAPANTTVSYYHGNDPAQWQRGLKSYGSVALGRIDSDIRVELKAHDRNVEKRFYLQPGANPAKIRLSVDGADTLRVTPGGELEMNVDGSGRLRFSRPIAYQQIEGRRTMVPVRYRVEGHAYGFELGDYDPALPLVIDPLIRVFAIKYTNDTNENAVMDVTADAQGNIYAAGYANGRLAIWKLDRRLEKLLAVTFFSEEARYEVDNIHSIALDSQGNVFVAGTTYNARFPVTPGCHDAVSDHHLIMREGFVTKFSADLATMLASTYIGGDNAEELYDLAINSRGQVYVVGYSTTGGIGGQRFPVTAGAYDTKPAPRSQTKAVVVRLDNNLSTVQAATFLGGSVDDDLDRNEDVAHNLVLDRQGNVWVTGRTTQPDFPVTSGCLDPTPNGSGDVFLAKLDADLSRLLVSTHIGGSQDEAPTDLLLDSKGNIFLLGWTFSANFPIPAGGYDTSYGNHEEDGFILKLNPGARKILGGTYLGGSHDGSNHGDDKPSAMTLTDDDSQLLVVGRTESRTFPTTPDCIGCTCDVSAAAAPGRDTVGDTDWGDGFISGLSSDLTKLIYSTFLGGGGVEFFDAVLINGDDLIVAGETQCGAFPMALADDATPRGVVMRFNDSEKPAKQVNPRPAAKGAEGGGGGDACFISVGGL